MFTGARAPKSDKWGAGVGVENLDALMCLSENLSYRFEERENDMRRRPGITACSFYEATLISYCSVLHVLNRTGHKVRV
jgi:hypothetical protein